MRISEAAKYMLALTDEAIAALVETGDWVEVREP